RRASGPRLHRHRRDQHGRARRMAAPGQAGRTDAARPNQSNDRRTRMNLAQANAIIEAGIAKAPEFSCNAGIAVVNEGGDIVAHVKMDGASRYAADMARGKAMVSAIFRQPSGKLTGEDAAS